jgi:NB-ARC domain
MKDDAREARSVAAVGSATKHLQLASVGMAGMAKTCAIKGIGHEDDVKRRYHDGVYFVSLGKDVNDECIVSQDTGIVKASGGKLVASEIILCETAAEAANKAGSWFSHRRCLFLCDDLWSSATRKNGFFADLNELTRLGDSSCFCYFLFSTRDIDIASHASSDLVVFKVREPRGQEASEMLRKHARIDKAALHGMKEAGDENIYYVLDMCARLPLALAVAGRAIARALRSASQTPAGALGVYACNLKSAREQLIDKGIDIGTVQYQGFTQVIETSLSAANDNFSSIGKFSNVDMHSSLSGFKRNSGY